MIYPLWEYYVRGLVYGKQNEIVCIKSVTVTNINETKYTVFKDEMT